MPPTNPAAKSDKNIAEHVFGDNHIERLRSLHKVQRSRVHVNSRGLYVGILLGNLVEDAAEERH